MNRDFRQQPYQTVYSTKNDYVSGGDPEILWRSPRIKIIDGDVIDDYEAGVFSLGKHSIGLIIAQSETVHKWLTMGAKDITPLLPSYAPVTTPEKHMAALMGVQVGRDVF